MKIKLGKPTPLSSQWDQSLQRQLRREASVSTGRFCTATLYFSLANVLVIQLTRKLSVELDKTTGNVVRLK
jgi:hypothetical protein